MLTQWSLKRSVKFTGVKFGEYPFTLEHGQQMVVRCVLFEPDN